MTLFATAATPTNTLVRLRLMGGSHLRRAGRVAFGADCGAVFFNRVLLLTGPVLDEWGQT